MATDLMRSERGNQGLSAVAVQLVSLWGKQSRWRRLVATFVLVALVLGGGWAIFGAQREAWSTVVSTRDGDEAHEVVTVLQADGIAARMRGKDVEVEPAELAHARAALAAAGLPDPRRGLRLFDDASPMQSSFGEQVNYKRAQQDELARSITALAPIDGARVHLAFGRRSIFKDQEQPPSASVALRIRPGARLTPVQVHGIRQLVASSVDGLRADDVTVIDSRGALLDGDDDGPVASRQEEIERAIATKVRAMLEHVVGIGKVAVVVSADVDLSRVEQTAETYDGARAAPTAAPRSVDGASAQAGTQGEGPRADPAAPGAAPRPPASPATEREPDASSRVVTATKFPHARLARLQLAVVVDYRRASDGSLVAPTEAELAQWTGLVHNAAGIDERRGDRVELKAMPFAPTAAPAPSPPVRAAPPVSLREVVRAFGGGWTAVQFGALGALVLLAVIASLWTRRHYLRRAMAAERRLAVVSAQAATNERSLTSELARLATVAQPERPEERSVDRSAEHLTEVVRADLHGAALVLSAWLSDDDGVGASAPPAGAPPVDGRGAARAPLGGAT